MKKLTLLFLMICSSIWADVEPGVYLDVSGAWIPVSGSDLSSAGRHFDGQVGSVGLATVGWQVENGISVGATFGLGPWRNSTSRDGLENWNFHQAWLAASMEYNLAVGDNYLLGLRLSGGPVWFDGSNSSQAVGEIAMQEVRSAATTAWLPEIKMERVIGQLGLGLSAGWFFSRFKEVRGILPSGAKNFLYHTDGSRVIIDNGGVLLRVYLRLYWDSPL